MEETSEGRIGRYLSGEMTDTERSRFEQDAAADRELGSLLRDAQRIWDVQSPISSGSWDTDQAWARFSSTHNVSPVPVSRKLPRRSLYWAAAASILLLAGVYTIFFRGGSPVTYAYQEGKTEPIILTDGSKIILNKASSVTVYPFTSKSRHLDLSGEAYFEVSSDPKRPFTISSGGTLTEVVGTSFNIRQTPGETRIFVHTGKIIFSSEKDSRVAVALTEGEAAVFAHDKMEMIANPSPNVSAWRTRQLRFVRMPMSTIIEDISTYFGQEVIIENESSRNCIINIPLAFKKPEITSVLEAVSATINAELVVEGNIYIIRGGRACS